MNQFIKTLVLLNIFLEIGCGSQNRLSPSDAMPETESNNSSSSEVPPALLPYFQVVTASTVPYNQEFSTLTTFRIPFRSMKSGTQVQLALRSGAIPLQIRGTWIGQHLGLGRTKKNTPLLFSGKHDLVVPAHTEVISDALSYPMVSNERFAISITASGGMPQGQDIVNDGMLAEGNWGESETIDGTAEPTIYGIKWVAVFGPPQKIIAVLGDSIGAGMASQGLEDRFIEVAQQELRYPVVDASEGGDGVERAYDRIVSDVFNPPGITDCVVQVGTNDLHREDADFVIRGLRRIFTKLREREIRPWGGTILPKGEGNLTLGGEKVRQEINQFIKTTPLVEGVVDFATAVADPLNPSHPRQGMLSQDGIHPSSAGHRAMARALVQAIRAKESPGYEDNAQ